MFGGGDPSITNLVPSDIEFDGNHFFKPTSWKQGHPDYAGTAWDVKNLFELKNAQRVWMHDNIFENCWPDAQSGYAIVLSPRNADGGAAWSTVEDVLIENNHILNSGSGVSILAQTDVPGRPAENTKRVTIQHNLFESIDSSIYLAAGSSPRCFLMAGKSTLDPAEHVRIIHNTSYHVTRPQTFMTFSSSGPMATDLVVKDNLVSQGNYGIAGDGTVAGKPTLDTYAPGYVFTNNGLVKFQSGDGAPTYPAGNWVISDADAVGYVDHPNGDYHLDTGSPYEDAATDGTDIGADIDALP